MPRALPNNPLRQPTLILAAVITLFVLFDLLWQLSVGMVSIKSVIVLGLLIIIQQVIRATEGRKPIAIGETTLIVLFFVFLLLSVFVGITRV